MKSPDFLADLKFRGPESSHSSHLSFEPWMRKQVSVVALEGGEAGRARAVMVAVRVKRGMRNFMVMGGFVGIVAKRLSYLKLYL